MREHHLAVTKTARYFTLGPLDERARDVWLVCHGFGQLAGRFIRHFQPLDDGARLIVAPEALMRFYLDGLEVPAAERRVGATWMTREDRLADINDYVGYLDALCADVFRRVPRDGARLTALGFSQGVATVTRWVAQGTTRVDRLVLWAGPFPPDLDLAAHAARFRGVAVSLVFGSRDEVATPEAVAAHERRLREHDIGFRIHRFDGGHQLDERVLRALAAE